MQMYSPPSFCRSKASGGIDAFEQELQDQSKVLEKGVYGLPEAVTNIQSLKRKISVLSEDRAGMSQIDYSPYDYIQNINILPL